MRTPNKTHLAAKAFFRDLLDAAGGPKRASTLTGHPDSHLSAMGAPHVHDRWPRLDHVIDLEQDCGQPLVTRFLADSLGYDLVERDGTTSPETTAEAALHLVRQIANFQVVKAEAEADGRIDRVERDQIIVSLQKVITEAHDLIVALKEGGK